jgi:signal transduction histidine kinase
VSRAPEWGQVTDAAVAVALVAAAEIHVWSGAAEGSRYVTAPAALAIAGSIAFRRRAPLAAVAVASTAIQVQSLLASSPQALWLIATCLVLFFSAGAELPTRAALVALGLGLAALTIDEARAHDRSAQGFAFALIALVTVPWLAGRAVAARERRVVTVEREGAETTRRALEEERARIARDLHDVVAHAVSLIVLKAEAGAAVLDAEPDRARAQLSSIQETGRQALGEMARLLGMLRVEAGEPLTQPRVAELPSLVEGVRRAGLDVTLAVEGDERPLNPGVDLTVFRVVQEALTNALKHGRAGGRARVVVRYMPDRVAIEVSNETSSSSGGTRGGHGLVGMRERVSLYDGSFRAGSAGLGAFTVTAELPA